jgi:hypothetical protein
MVLGIITSIAACPAIIGTTEAVRQGQSQNRREQHRGRKSNLLVSCSDPSRKARNIHGGTIVLRDQKVSVSCFPRGLRKQSSIYQEYLRANGLLFTLVFVVICYDSESQDQIKKRPR